jgi:hypothetical protein
MFNSLRIRTKLAFALVIPLIALVVSSSLVVSAADRRARDASDEAAAVSEQVALATAALGPSGILTALSNERTSEAIVLIGLDPMVLGMGAPQADTRQATDQAAEQFRVAIAAKPKAVQDTYRSAIDGLAALREIRTRTDASTARALDNPDATAQYDAYSRLIRAAFDANTQAALGVDNSGLRAGVRFIDHVTRHQDTTSVVQRAIGSALTFGGVQSLNEAPASLVEAAGLTKMADELRLEMEKTDNPFYAGLARELFASPSITAAQKTRENAIAGQAISIEELISQASQENTAVYDRFLKDGATRLQADAEKFRNQAQTEADDAATQSRLILLVTFGVLGLAVVVTVLASRSISRPLSRLVHSAEDMATQTLPTTVQQILEAPLGDDVEVPDLARIDDRGGYEIAEVASALNTVQRSATDLAVEQAVLRRNIADAFVNLGRRNQALLTRLLEAITQMERDEADPDELERLFTLDHLATRMRRNAESLVVLAGVETRRQWSDPVALADVVRGALGEVENFERVEIVELNDARVHGGAVAELTHLIAELLENSLNYSPPSRTVEVHGRAHGGGYDLWIVDHGMGMPADELAVANLRLSGGESFTVAPSRYLGHYVVGRQATRLNLAVTLADTPGGGTTATIGIGAVIVAEERAPEPEPTTSFERRFAHRALAGRSEPLTTSELPAIEATTSGPGADAAPTEDAEALSGTVAESDDGAVTAEVAMATGPEPGPAPEPTTTTSGYRRRVRGTHAPDTSVRTARAARAPRPGGGGSDAMRSALSSMQAGMKRSHTEDDDIPEES